MNSYKTFDKDSKKLLFKTNEELISEWRELKSLIETRKTIINSRKKIPEEKSNFSLKMKQVKQSVLNILALDSPPSYISEIWELYKLIETVHLEYIYKSDISRAVWMLVDDGLISVKSGKIKLR